MRPFSAPSAVLVALGMAVAAADGTLPVEGATLGIPGPDERGLGS